MDGIVPSRLSSLNNAVLARTPRVRAHGQATPNPFFCLFPFFLPLTLPLTIHPSVRYLPLPSPPPLPLLLLPVKTSRAVLNCQIPSLPTEMPTLSFSSPPSPPFPNRKNTKPPPPPHSNSSSVRGRPTHAPHGNTHTQQTCRRRQVRMRARGPARRRRPSPDPRRTQGASIGTKAKSRSPR